MSALLTDEQIARVAHEANRAYCEAIGDFSQHSWESAPDWQRRSAIAGVRFHRENPGAGPEVSHESWYAMKLAEGWKYGEVKDPVNKEHPCMVPFEDLPEKQQAKDVLFKSVVDSLAMVLA